MIVTFSTISCFSLGRISFLAQSVILQNNKITNKKSFSSIGSPVTGLEHLLKKTFKLLLLYQFLLKIKTKYVNVTTDYQSIQSYFFFSSTLYIVGVKWVTTIFDFQTVLLLLPFSVTG